MADPERTNGQDSSDEHAREVEHIIPVEEIDLVEVARKTDGAVFFDLQEAKRVEWGNDRQLSLETNDYSAVLTIEFDGGEDEDFGFDAAVVIGTNYVALVKSGGGLYVDAIIITNGTVGRHHLPWQGASKELIEARKFANNRKNQAVINNQPLLEVEPGRSDSPNYDDLPF